MTEKQIKKLQNGLTAANACISTALEKLGNTKEEINLSNKLRHFAREAEELAKEVAELTPKEVPPTPKGTKPPKGLIVNNVSAYLAKHPEAIEKKVAKGGLMGPQYEDPDAKNKTCRHYCGDYCDIGMDMTFCSKRCAYCTNMPGSSKAYA